MGPLAAESPVTPARQDAERHGIQANQANDRLDARSRYPFLILGRVRPQRMRGPTGASLTIVSFRTAVRAVFCRRRTLAGTARSCGGRPAFGDRGCWRSIRATCVLLSALLWRARRPGRG